jgi:membrane associated rhomboid family serine protease
MRPITERLSPVIRNLVIANTLIFLFYAAVRESQPFITNHLALGPGTLAGEVWQPLSSLFIHLDFLSFAFNMLGLWFVGATIERSVGTKRFLALFFGTGVAANVTMVLASAALGRAELSAGSGSAVLALFVAFGVIFDRTQARVLGGLVLEARVLTAILVAFALLADLARASWANLAGDVVAVVLGFVMAGGRGAMLGNMWATWKARRVRRRYQILEGGRRRPPYVN